MALLENKEDTDAFWEVSSFKRLVSDEKYVTY